MDDFGVVKEFNRHVFKAFYYLTLCGFHRPQVSQICDLLQSTFRNNVPVNLSVIVQQSFKNMARFGLLEDTKPMYSKQRQRYRFKRQHSNISIIDSQLEKKPAHSIQFLNSDGRRQAFIDNNQATSSCCPKIVSQNESVAGESVKQEMLPPIETNLKIKSENVIKEFIKVEKPDDCDDSQYVGEVSTEEVNVKSGNEHD